MKLIAETAMHHQGDFDFMVSLIDALINKSKADYIKTHLLFDIDEYFLKDHPGYELTKKWLFNKQQWKTIFDMIMASDKKPMMLFNDSKAVEFGSKYLPELIEIHSVSINDIYLLDSLKQNVDKKTKIVLGIGGSSLYEIDSAINYLKHDNIILMFGFQNYPTDYNDINFRKVRKIMNLYPEFEFGYADHTGWDHPNNQLITLFGAAFGMEFIEKHVTTDYGKERIDWSAAISIDSFNELKDKLEILRKCLGNGKLELNTAEKKYSLFGPMKKAAILNKDIKVGDIFSMTQIDFKRTSQISDISQTDILNFVGKCFNKDIKKDICLRSSHFKNS